uniref:Cathepsin W n=1 Tax=Callithrix jacchus TaxID=9483 RepID=F7G5V1_CALJA
MRSRGLPTPRLASLLWFLKPHPHTLYLHLHGFRPPHHFRLHCHGSDCPSLLPPGPAGGRPSPRHQRLPYGPEHARRLDIFAHNLVQAQRLQEEDLGTAEFGVTPFSDLTEEEFGQLYGHQRAAGGVPSMSRVVGSEEPEESVPHTCDWRKVAGAISFIRNQGNCLCCWAMAAAGNIEALWSINFLKFVNVSVQELLDCGRCGDGCHGGYVWDAFSTVLKNSGVASESDYPFQANFRPHRCHAKTYNKVAWIMDFIFLPDDEQRIAQYLATYGPITVTINAKHLQLYQKGVIKARPTTCDPQFVDHSVLLVGFGSEKSEGMGAKTVSSQSRHPRSTPYWILKNSWGAQWGEEGYFRLHRGSNTCGITKYPVTARVQKPNVKPQFSCPP